MNKTIKTTQKGYHSLINSVGILLEEARKKTYTQVNQILIKTYWEIGKRIVEYEQKGGGRAGYGKELLAQLSRDLKIKYGKGFSRSNLQYMRLLYLKYPKCQTLSGKLSWSHYIELLIVEDDLKRLFYEKQCFRERWSVRELGRQIDSLLFERLTLSKNKKEVLALAQENQSDREGGRDF